MRSIKHVDTELGKVRVFLDDDTVLLIQPGLFVPVESVANAIRQYTKSVEVTNVAALRLQRQQPRK